MPDSNASWPAAGESKFSPALVRQSYDQLRQEHFAGRRLSDLEITQYLELYLWPNYDHEASEPSVEHAMSIVLMVNEKFKERVPVWTVFRDDSEKFSRFFNQIAHLATDSSQGLSMKERTYLLVFFINCFSSIEEDLVRNQLAKYVAPSMWLSISSSRREREVANVPKLKKYFKIIASKDAKLNEEQLKQIYFERNFLRNYTNQFLEVVASIREDSQQWLDKQTLIFCERFVELLIDLESMSLTRRFFNVLLDELHVFVHCQQSDLTRRPDSKLFNKLLELLKFYVRFEIDSLTGTQLTAKQISKLHYEKLVKLQKIVFQKSPHLKDFYLSCVSQIDTRDALIRHLSQLTDEEFNELAAILFFSQITQQYSREFITEIIVFSHERYESQLDQLNQTPLYPTEKTIWDENIVPTQYYNGESCLALPKLNLQFLSLHDYLLRNLHLFRLESTYEIRQDIENAVSRMKPWRNEDGESMFSGWSRMALPIDNFAVVTIGKPNLGERAPSRVKAEVRVALSVRNEVKREWQSLRRHDVGFLITVRPPNTEPVVYNFKSPFIPQVGLVHVRGCEVEGMLDPYGKLIDDNTTETPTFDNDYRIYRVWLDPNQYFEDMLQDDTLYDSFNILMRRKPKENNFKAVLETIREMMNTECVVPEWLHELILGYGDPSSAHYSEIEGRLTELDFNDTFLDLEHLKESFPGRQIIMNDRVAPLPPFKLTFKNDNEIEVHPYHPLSRGPYKHLERKKNQLRFTPTQIEGIHSGMQPGLTVIVGPPGTGKTDVAVQIISNLYHNFPNQRTLIVTHSNQALNQLFEKIIHLDIDERHLLRLGHGQDQLETEKDFTRFGRVDYALNHRLHLLFQVSKLAKCLKVEGDVGYTCETASYFFLHHVLSRYEEFTEKLGSIDRQTVVDWPQLFPFTDFFDDCDLPLFRGTTFDENLEIARSCYRHIRRMFTILGEFHAFEMLRTGTDRSNYLLLREAKIIAMTCTHAALKRKELVQLGFQYDNILMEESAQILEIETFIPVLLQNPQHGHNRLKRWIMIGDHNQLPPVIKNTAFQKYSNMEQSLFTRFVRLGVPKISLDAQGRARSSICSLYRWKYDKLGDLSHVKNFPEFQQENTGFKFDYQFVNVNDFNGVGESEPIPYFYQNLAEAEFVVATFMYMRLLGYPADRISILTTYNGQKHLIRDVIDQRCASNPLIGSPFKISTVDKFQGLQSDYILLSLVRTKSVGHLRDVRRLVVAMSRARLGLYVFGRASLFSSCKELRPVFDLLLQRPQQLHLFPYEYYPSTFTDREHSEQLMVMSEIPQMVQFVFDHFKQTMDYWKEKDPEVLEKFIAQFAPKETPLDEKPVSEVVSAKDSQPTEMSQNKPDDYEPFEKITETDTGRTEQNEVVLDDEDLK